ncbi:P-loop containing nucleoside triphosphate hydrolase protein [Lasiosphaeria miniovina]|uniref:P-loop containing nucleoside triphosphate hydrolase protein n=1 Tax=Lasiosphaeria miniovina TaxID=1954250 RepID=A0AA40EAQ0_9PEZI|nr:P-loop containing nucleoside triphosphate hydrolase protein [Lasiosphaeria miniovina]KAK0728553.1 P-loop containing nucleoside triphosphate hydrolase protein [Lasiosphaeria miniovina]
MRVLSIGTGLGDVVAIKDKRLSILKALKDMATSSKKVAQRLDGQFGDTSQYSRFNVERGLEDITLSDWEKRSTISAHTHNYLRENQRSVKKFVKNFLVETEYGSRSGIAPAEQAAVAEGSQELPGRAVLIGAGNGRRVPHEAPPSASNDVQAGQAELGGTNHFPSPCHYIPLPENSRFVGREAALLYVQQRLFGPAHSRGRIAVVGLGGIGKTQVALQVANWAKKNRPQYSVLWLPALSNTTFEQACTEIAKRLGIRRADDWDIKETVQQYLSSDKARPWLLVVDNADDLDMVLGGLDSLGLIDCLPRSEHGKIMFTTRSVEVAEAVAEGGVIKLADMDGREALDLLEKCLQRRDLLSDKTGTGNAVATTWLVSFDQIRKLDTAAADLLMFMSHIEPKGIPRSILPSAESQEEMVHAIGTLYSYAFLNRREQAVVLLEKVLAIREQILIETHPDRLTSQHTLAVAYRANGQVTEAVVLLEKVVAIREQILIETHPDRLTSQHELAVAYQANGQVTEAVALLEKVVAIREQTLVETHPDRLGSQHTLAVAYQANGQVTEAVALLEKVLAIREQTLIETHPDRLASEGWLTYIMDNLNV